MKQSIIKELEQHVIDLIHDGAITKEEDDAHNIAFNYDYYISGYNEANK